MAIYRFVVLVADGMYTFATVFAESPADKDAVIPVPTKLKLVTPVPI